MQTDLHFYGTYVIARAAGFPSVCAQRIAYASQFVDDSTHAESKRHKDGGVLHAIATSHHPLGSEFSAEINPDDPRLVWIPFHFLPGGAGDTLEEQLLCIKDNDIAQEMVEHHIDAALGKEVFAMELLGIMTHVYLDTFSHYGFSGVGSEYNEVESGPFETIGEVSPKTRRDLEESYSAFAEKYVMQAEAWTLSRFLVGSTKKFAIGHGAVATYPDKPFLHWRVAFKKPRPNNGTESFRNNTETYLEGCEKLHGYFSCFVKRWRSESKIQPFSEIKDKLKKILRTEGSKKERIEEWKRAIRSGNLYSLELDGESVNYDADDWERDKNNFCEFAASSDIIKKPVYRFHQAASLHRGYVLKELLPAHGIAVY